MKKKNGAFGAGHFSLGTLAGGRPGTTIFQNPGGGGGGWGVSHTRTGPGRPPVGGTRLMFTDMMKNSCECKDAPHKSVAHST